jgi:hypothetical protein
VALLRGWYANAVESTDLLDRKIFIVLGEIVGEAVDLVLRDRIDANAISHTALLLAAAINPDQAILESLGVVVGRLPRLRAGFGLFE